MKNFVLPLGLFLLISCTSIPSRISSYVNVCCADPDYVTFSVTPKNIPAFLGPIIVSNFIVALAGHDLQPVSEDADLHVELRYEQLNLDLKEIHDDFMEHLSSGGDARFIAQIAVDMRDGKTGEIVWSGGIRRIHDVNPGEYMHTGRASMAFLDSFHKLLEKYPAK